MTSLRRKAEEGVVSLLTVIFFMIFISLIVVGFTTIVVADQRQTIDNDLAASALAAARSGVEDGKRILLYCAANPSATGCAEVQNNTSCDALKSGNGSVLAHTLGIDVDSSGEGVTGGTGAEDYQQYFTCLTVATQTATLTTTLNAGTDYIQQLRTVSGFNTLTVKWESDTINLTNPTSPIMTTGWPTLTSWNTSSRFPVIQLEVIPYTSSSFSNLDTLEGQTKTLYLVPCVNSSTGNVCTGGQAANISADARSGSGSLRLLDSPPIIYTKCTAGTTCSVILGGFTPGTQYYVRATLLYANSVNLTLSVANGASSVNFDNVQPQIDVTGRTNDVYKRVQVQVSSAPTLPTSTALDSAVPICKTMTVQTASGSYDCN